jgi:hypothetical protein
MMNLKTIGLVGLAVVAAGCFAPQVHAGEVSSVGDAMNRATFNESGDFYNNTGIGRQATLLFGLSLPDREGVNDAYAVDKIYQTAIRQRVSTPISTTDLPNPFTSSLLSNAGAAGN